MLAEEGNHCESSFAAADNEAGSVLENSLLASELFTFPFFASLQDDTPIAIMHTAVRTAALKLSLSVFAAALRAPDAGVYGTWVSNCSIPEQVKGTGSVIQWSDLEPADGMFNWTALEQVMAIGHCDRYWTSLQINANTHPVYMQAIIPSAEPWGDSEDDDKRYLQYYHPAFVTRMQRMVASVAQYLARRDTHDSAISVVRQNWDAIGTEHFDVPSALWDPHNWTNPEGVPLGPVFVPTITQQKFEEAVFPSYLSGYSISGSPRLYVRNNLALNAALFEPYKPFFANGTFSFFQTSSEPEPHELEEAQRFAVLREWCRPGTTTCYSEPWTSAFGRSDDPSFTPPSAWLWWRVLADLDMGVSRLAMYGDDLVAASTGDFGGKSYGPVLQREFMAAVLLADRYAGYHALPETSPGAYVAMRQSVRQLGGYNKKVTDYSVLAQLSPGTEPTGLDARVNGTAVAGSNGTRFTIGNASQRFGTWARLLEPSTPARVCLDDAFVGRINAAAVPVKLCVTALESCAFAGAEPAVSTCTLTISAGAVPVDEIDLKATEGTASWITASRILTPPLTPSSDDCASIIISAEGVPRPAIALHMVELVTNASAPCSANIVG